VMMDLCHMHSPFDAWSMTVFEVGKDCCTLVVGILENA
jgi:hypothetical protein